MDLLPRSAGQHYGIDELAALECAINPTGFVVDSFRCALHCLYTTHTFEDALIKAVNFGGDADTIGAITGGLAGVLYGFKNIPSRWIETLDGDLSAELTRLAEKAHRNRAAL